MLDVAVEADDRGLAVGDRRMRQHRQRIPHQQFAQFRAPGDQSERSSSAACPASGLPITAQAATRVTGRRAGRPPSLWMVSLTTSSRRNSMVTSRSGGESCADKRKLGLLRRQRAAHEVDRIGLAERKRRIAAEQEMLRRHDRGRQSAGYAGSKQTVSK